MTKDVCQWTIHIGTYKHSKQKHFFPSPYLSFCMTCISKKDHLVILSEIIFFGTQSAFQTHLHSVVLSSHKGQHLGLVPDKESLIKGLLNISPEDKVLVGVRVGVAVDMGDIGRIGGY